jgi:hypothetical protein
LNWLSSFTSFNSAWSTTLSSGTISSSNCSVGYIDINCIIQSVYMN